jgi:hypothetical protein
MGLCFDAKHDVLFERGWPNLVVPIDGHPRDKSPAKSAMSAHMACDPIYFTEWPRETLVRYLRLEAAVLGVATKGKGYDSIQKARTDAGAKAAENATSMSSAEAIAALELMVRSSDEIYPFQTDAFVYGVETIAGSDAVLDALVPQIAKNPKRDSNVMEACIGSIAFLSLRASKAAAARAKSELEKVYQRVAPKPSKKAPTTPNDDDDDDRDERVTALDCALHGTPAVRRALGKYVALDCGGGLLGRPELEYTDDAALIREKVASAKASAAMSSRVAWLGGAATLAGLSARKWPARQLPSVVRDFGMFRDPEVVDFMLSLIGKTSVKDAPIAWFRAHVDYAKPLLKASKSSMAKGVLRQLGG